LTALLAQQLGRMRRVVVASPAFLRRHGVPKHPDALRDAPCVHFNGTDGDVWRFRDGTSALQVTVHRAMTCNLSLPLL